MYIYMYIFSFCTHLRMHIVAYYQRSKMVCGPSTQSGHEVLKFDRLARRPGSVPAWGRPTPGGSFPARARTYR